MRPRALSEAGSTVRHMRFLHTSDWHLGRSLHGVDLHDAQRAFVTQLERLTIESQADCVVVAGDIFDRAVPPVESVALFTQALTKLSAHASVIVIAGNHDSATRLGFGSPLYRAGIHVVTELNQVGTAVPITVADQSVLFYPIPYLDPDQARTVLAPNAAEGSEPLARSHEAVMTAALQRISADRQHRSTVTGQAQSAVVIAHAFVVGGEPSDSERDIKVGGVDGCSVALFGDFNYVALGHLHGPQQITAGAAGAVIRYAGSPLRYSFSEQNQHKSIAIVDIDYAGRCQVELVPLPQPRGMATLSGELADLLTEANRARYNQDWLRVLVTDSARPAELHERVRQFFPHAISILHQPASLATSFGMSSASIARSDPVDVCDRFIGDVTNTAATAAETDVLRQAYETVRAMVNP